MFGEAFRRAQRAVPGAGAGEIVGVGDEATPSGSKARMVETRRAAGPRGPIPQGTAAGGGWSPPLCARAPPRPHPSRWLQPAVGGSPELDVG